MNIICLNILLNFNKQTIMCKSKPTVTCEDQYYFFDDDDDFDSDNDDEYFQNDIENDWEDESPFCEECGVNERFLTSIHCHDCANRLGTEIMASWPTNYNDEVNGEEYIKYLFKGD